jgi:hypothetical protein
MGGVPLDRTAISGVRIRDNCSNVENVVELCRCVQIREYMQIFELLSLETGEARMLPLLLTL